MRSLLLAVLVAFPLSAAAAFPTFPDVPLSHPNHAAISVMAEQGVLKGYPDGTFKPEMPVNRAEFAKMTAISGYSQNAIDETLEKFPDEGRHSFPDVSPSDWFDPYVRFAFGEGYVKGYPDGTFKPEQGVNFVEAAKMISEIRGDFAPDAQAWYRPYVLNLESHHAIPMTVHRFDQSLTRGEVAEILFRLQLAEKEQQETPTRTYEELSAGVMPPILYVQTNPSQDPPMDYNVNRRQEMLVRLLDLTQGGRDANLGLIETSVYGEDFAVHGRTLFFIRTDRQIGTFDLDSKKTELLPVPVLRPLPPDDQTHHDDTASDFFVSGDKLFYMKGDCAEGYPCDLRVYDLATGDERYIVEGLEKNTENPGSWRIYDVRDGKATIAVIYGDAGWLGGTVFKADLQTGKLTKVDDVAYTSACIDEQSVFECQPGDREEGLAAKAKFDSLLHSEPSSCGTASFSYEYDVERSKNQLVITTRNGTVVRYDDARFVKCME